MIITWYFDNIKKLNYYFMNSHTSVINLKNFYNTLL